MNADFFSGNWALIVAVFPALAALILVTRYLLGRTASGQLRDTLKAYRQAHKELDKSRKLAGKTGKRVESLTAKAGKVRPSILQAAREAAEDAKALEKIASDKVQVTANHVRRVIHEEFPPNKQQRLRQKYLPQDVADGRPYTF